MNQIILHTYSVSNVFAQVNSLRKRKFAAVSRQFNCRGLAAGYLKKIIAIKKHYVNDLRTLCEKIQKAAANMGSR